MSLDHQTGRAVLLGSSNLGAVIGSESTADSGFVFNGQLKLAIKFKSVLVDGAAAATLTATDFIPAKALVFGVNLRVLSTFSNTSLTSMNIGDGSDADLWGATIALTAGTKTSSADYTAAAASFKFYPAANSVVITGVGASFAANGQLRLELVYASCGVEL